MYGPGDGQDKFVPRFIQSARSNFSDNLLLTPGEQKRDFIYVEDVVSAIETVIRGNDRYDFKSFEVGSGKSTSLREFAERVLEVMGSNATPPFGSISYRPDEIMNSNADISALVEIGWTPKTTLHQGIVNTVQHHL
jgi:nucleoside-diphosphate-sugar epimerase